MSGIVFGSGVIDTPKSIQFFTSIIGDPQGTSYGAQKCDSVPFTCEVPSGVMTEDGWDIQMGNSTNNLIDLIKAGNYCDPSTDFECPEVKIDLSCLSLCSDVIFLVDDSKNVTNEAFELMQRSVQELIGELDGQPNESHTYAVTLYAGITDQSIAVPTTSDPAIAGDFDRLYDRGGNGVHAAFEYVMNSIDNGDLTLRGNCYAKIILFTNVQSLLDNGTFPAVFNDIKLPPYEAEVVVIRYQSGDDAIANPQAAAVSSLGVPYEGGVYANPADPQGEGTPRRFYPTSFAEGVPGLADDLRCNSLSIDISNYCLNPFIQWSAEGGGEILSFAQNVTEIEIAGPGVYIVDVGCSNGCTMKDVFIIDENGVVQRSGDPDGTRYVDGKAMSPGEYEEYLAGELSLKSLPDYQLSLFPNPSSTHINLIYNNDRDLYPAFKIYRSDGALVKEITDYRIGEERTIDTQDLPSGLYYLRVTTSTDIPVQPFTIIK